MEYPHVRFRIDFGADNAVGPGKIALLEQIERSGSLTKAARNLGMSSRRAGLLLEFELRFWEDPGAAVRRRLRRLGKTLFLVIGLWSQKSRRMR